MYLPHPILLFDAPAAPLPDAVDAWTPGSELPAMLSRFFAEPDPRPDWQWAEENVVFDSKQSPGNPGPYRSAVAPHTRWLGVIANDPSVRQITIKKNSQGAWTEAVLNHIRRRVAQRPGNVLYVIDSLTEARRIVTIRLVPTLERCPATAQAMSEDASDHSTLTLNLRDMFAMFVGGGSIGAVANKPVDIGVVDEADKLPRITGGHGHVVHEMKARFKSTGGLLFVLSAPNEEQDVTTTEFNKGTQHKLFNPCPHCGHFQELVQEQLRFDHCKNADGDYDLYRVEKEAYYACIHSGTTECPDGRIYDHHKPAMVERAEWRATNPNPEPGHISLESSDLFSLFVDARFGRIALDLIDAIKNPIKKRSVQRDRFGKEYRQRKAQVKEEDLKMLRGRYLRGTMPVECAYMAIGSDYQGDGPRWVKGGFARNGDLYIVDWGDGLSLDELVIQADKPVPDLVTGRQWRTVGGLVDEGYKQGEVLSFCVRAAYAPEQFRFLPAKGRGNLQNAGELVIESPREHEGVEFRAYHFNDDKFKSDLYISRIKEFPKIKAGLSKVARIWLPADVGGEFTAELMGEQLQPEINAWGHTRYVWKKTGPNHWGDATKLLLVLWNVIGPTVLAALPPPYEGPAQAA